MCGPEYRKTRIVLGWPRDCDWRPGRVLSEFLRDRYSAHSVPAPAASRRAKTIFRALSRCPTEGLHSRRMHPRSHTKRQSLSPASTPFFSPSVRRRLNSICFSPDPPPTKSWNFIGRCRPSPARRRYRQTTTTTTSDRPRLRPCRAPARSPALPPAQQMTTHERSSVPARVYYYLQVFVTGNITNQTFVSLPPGPRAIRAGGAADERADQRI